MNRRAAPAPRRPASSRVLAAHVDERPHLEVGATTQQHWHAGDLDGLVEVFASLNSAVSASQPEPLEDQIDLAPPPVGLEVVGHRELGDRVGEGHRACPLELDVPPGDLDLSGARVMVTSCLKETRPRRRCQAFRRAFVIRMGCTPVDHFLHAVDRMPVLDAITADGVGQADQEGAQQCDHGRSVRPGRARRSLCRRRRDSRRSGGCSSRRSPRRAEGCARRRP